ncbi:MAG: hypothetical protein ACREHG_00820 [Candidatus Saccharimonadales bacterium]
MTDWRATLWFENKKSKVYTIQAGIPQGSPILPILFLFYNLELIEACNPQYGRVSGLGFVDDVNVLAWGQST